jgi:hypothetical protein
MTAGELACGARPATHRIDDGNAYRNHQRRERWHENAYARKALGISVCRFGYMMTWCCRDKQPIKGPLGGPAL